MVDYCSSADIPVPEQGGDDGAGKRAEDRNPAVGPVAGALALDRQDEVRDARPEVTCGVDRVPGGTTEAGTDSDDKQAHGQWTEPRRRLSAHDDPEHEHEGADGLSDEVPAVRTDGRPGGEYRELLGCETAGNLVPLDEALVEHLGAMDGIGLQVEVLLEGEECQYGTEEPADHLAGPVHEHVGDRRVDALGEIYSSHQESEGDRRVEVATGLVGDVNTRHYPDAPPKVDKKPSAVESLALRQKHGRYHTGTEHDQNGCAENLRHECLGEKTVQGPPLFYDAIVMVFRTMPRETSCSADSPCRAKRANARKISRGQPVLGRDLRGLQAHLLRGLVVGLELGGSLGLGALTVGGDLPGPGLVIPAQQRSHDVRDLVDRAQAAVDEIADIIAPLLGWDDKTRTREITAYRERAEAQAAAELQPDDESAEEVRLKAAEIAPQHRLPA